MTTRNRPLNISEFINAGAELHRAATATENTETPPADTQAEPLDGEALRHLDRDELAALFFAAHQPGPSAA